MYSKAIQRSVELGLIVAILVVACTIFLSSCAEASHGQYSRPLFDTVYSSVRRSLADNGRFAAVVLEVPRSPFERVNEGVRYIFQWPRLPTVAEQQIKIAQDRLAVVLSESNKAREEVRRATQLRLDYEALVKAGAMALLSLGVIISCIGLMSRRA